MIVKRKSNPKESTIEAWGLVDGQPTSRHFDVMIYDDVVTLESVTTPEMINKTTKAWEISLNLLSERGVSRYVGTRYHFSDTYKTIIEREAAIPRIHTATDDGTFSGNPVLITKEKLNDLIKRMGSFTASCQLFLDPLMDDVQRFDPKWVRYGLKDEHEFLSEAFSNPLFKELLESIKEERETKLSLRQRFVNAIFNLFNKKAKIS